MFCLSPQNKRAQQIFNDSQSVLLTSELFCFEQKLNEVLLNHGQKVILQAELVGTDPIFRLYLALLKYEWIPRKEK